MKTHLLMPTAAASGWMNKSNDSKMVLSKKVFYLKRKKIFFSLSYLHLLHYSRVRTGAKKSLFGRKDQVGFEWLGSWGKLFRWGLEFALGNSNVEGNFQLHLRSRPWQPDFGNRVAVAVNGYLEATCFFLPSLLRLTRKMLRCGLSLSLASSDGGPRSWRALLSWLFSSSFLGLSEQNEDGGSTHTYTLYSNADMSVYDMYYVRLRTQKLF